MALPRRITSIAFAIALGTAAFTVPGVSSGVDVSPAAAPASATSAYGVINSLNVGGLNSQVVISGDLTPGTTDDTIYVVDDSVIKIFPPLATSASPSGVLQVASTIEDVIVTEDDTIYVATSGLSPNFQGLLVFAKGATGAASPAYSSTTTDAPTGLALGGSGTLSTDDDSVYMVAYGGANGVYQFSPTLDDSSVTLFSSTNVQPGSVVVSGSTTFTSADDTVLVRGNGYGSGALIALTPALDDSVWRDPLGAGGSSLGLIDDSILVASYNQNRVINASNWDDSVQVSFAGTTVAVSASGVWLSFQYGGGYVRPSAGIIQVDSLEVLSVLDLGYTLSATGDAAAASDGTFYAVGRGAVMSVIDKFTTAAMSPVRGGAGTVVTLPMSSASGRVMDDSAVTAVWWGDTSVPFTRIAGQNTVTAVVPENSGTVNVVVELAGGAGIAMGSFGGSVPPAPATPAGPPQSVSATAADASVVVSWAAPSSAGSFPVTTYQVSGSPSGSCLVPALTLSCDITGLTNGESYSFRVRALTGAGWGSWSEAVSVTPLVAPSIVITGAREGRTVKVTGATTGLAGEQVTPWVRFPGPAGYSAGVEVQTVLPDGSFTWQRRTSKKVYVYFRADDGVASKRVIIAAR